MSRAELLRRLVTQRLAQAADEICAIFIRTMEEEAGSARTSSRSSDLLVVSKETDVSHMQSRTSSDQEDMVVSHGQDIQQDLTFSNVQVKIEKQESPDHLQDHLEMVYGEQVEQRRWGTPASSPEPLEDEQQWWGPPVEQEQPGWGPPVEQEQPGWGSPVKQEPPEPSLITAQQEDSTTSSLKVDERPAWWQGQPPSQTSSEQERRDRDGDRGDSEAEPSPQTSNSSNSETEDSDDDEWSAPKTAKKNPGAARPDRRVQELVPVQEPAAGPEPAGDGTSDSSDPETEDSDEDFLQVKRPGSPATKSKPPLVGSSEPGPKRKRCELSSDFGLLACPRCQRGLMHKSSLKRHLESHCKERRPPRKRRALSPTDRTGPAEAAPLLFQCSRCSKSFRSRTCLDLHVKLHREPSSWKVPGASDASAAPGGDR